MTDLVERFAEAQRVEQAARKCVIEALIESNPHIAEDLDHTCWVYMSRRKALLPDDDLVSTSVLPYPRLDALFEPLYAAWRVQKYLMIEAASEGR